MNNESLRLATESANFIGEFHNTFIGNYNTTWHDKDGIAMVLSIRIKNSNPNILLLEWHVNDKLHFAGEGFINNGILIGCYYDGYLKEKIEPLLSK
nr:hypothetical protein [uncultured Flavobacterium sp.]